MTFKYTIAIITLCAFPAHAETMGEPVPMEISATVNNVAVCAVRHDVPACRAWQGGQEVDLTLVEDTSDSVVYGY